MTDMKATEFGGYQAGPASGASVRHDHGQWTLVFVRELPHPPHKVWAALTDPANLREWAPFDADRNLGSTGPAQLTMAGPEPEQLESVVRQADEPVLLEYTWGGDVLRWQLEEIATGTRLTLHHTLEDRSWLSKVTAGWHICIDVLERALDGRPVGRVVADAARVVGWERLNAEYAAQFGSHP
jgi:uncharacterized protein YndB with AHSA1/START domain